MSKKGVQAVNVDRDAEYENRERAHAGSGVVSLANQRQYPSEMGVNRVPVVQ